MKKVFVTRKIVDAGQKMLEAKGYEVRVSEKDGVLTKSELIKLLQAEPYDAVLSLLTDKIDAEVFDASPSTKIFANYAVGFDNIDCVEAEKRGVVITNTPGALITQAVAEHTFGLLVTIASRLLEADQFLRKGLYKAWDPLLFLGEGLTGKTVGILGLGRIGSRFAHHASRGFGMPVIYHDVARNQDFEQKYGAVFKSMPEEVLREADFVSLHVPLLPSTRHLINKDRLAMMKPSAILVNTSRGPVVDEGALVEALRSGVIRGAALDVFEHEPALAPGLAELSNVIITPHIASATEEARSEMSRLAGQNIIEFFEGRTPPNLVRQK